MQRVAAALTQRVRLARHAGISALAPARRYFQLITGVGDSYCAGADLKEFIPMVAEGARARAAGGERPTAPPPAEGEAPAGEENPEEKKEAAAESSEPPANAAEAN